MCARVRVATSRPGSVSHNARVSMTTCTLRVEIKMHRVFIVTKVYVLKPKLKLNIVSVIALPSAVDVDI